jgi:hypothetical protein
MPVPLATGAPMNAQDADVVHFLDLAAHLGYLGYLVKPPEDDSRWYHACHDMKYTFRFARWRQFLWLQTSVVLSAAALRERPAALAWVNTLRQAARLTKYHVYAGPDENLVVDADAFLPSRYDRRQYATWLLQWVKETDCLAGPVT